MSSSEASKFEAYWLKQGQRVRLDVDTSAFIESWNDLKNYCQNLDLTRGAVHTRLATDNVDKTLC